MSDSEQPLKDLERILTEVHSFVKREVGRAASILAILLMRQNLRDK